jgi:hypothetical protein
MYLNSSFVDDESIERYDRMIAHNEKFKHGFKSRMKHKEKKRKQFEIYVSDNNEQTKKKIKMLKETIKGYEKAIVKYDEEIDKINKGKKEYMNKTQTKCFICLGPDNKFCICHHINDTILIIYLIYQKRHKNGEIKKLPLIFKSIFSSIIYPYVTNHLVMKFKKFRKRRDELTEYNENFKLIDYFKFNEQKQMRKKKEKNEKEAVFLAYYFDINYIYLGDY